VILDATPVIHIEGTRADVHRGRELSQSSLRYADAIYVAAAQRHRTSLLTTDTRIERSGAPIRCPIITITAPPAAST
jgi:predicted nucleic acid-binding protein